MNREITVLVQSKIKIVGGCQQLRQEPLSLSTFLLVKIQCIHTHVHGIIVYQLMPRYVVHCLLDYLCV